MRGNLEHHGIYELFLTSRGSQILNLNNRDYFTVVKGQKGEILVGTGTDHEKGRTVKRGRFYLAYYDNDPELSNLPHLYLEEGNKFREWILPNDKPTEIDYQKKPVKSGKLVSKTQVEEHIDGEKQFEPENLKSKSKEELYRLAQIQNIPGRSKMSRDQLLINLLLINQKGYHQEKS